MPNSKSLEISDSIKLVISNIVIISIIVVSLLFICVSEQLDVKYNLNVFLKLIRQGFPFLFVFEHLGYMLDLCSSWNLILVGALSNFDLMVLIGFMD